MTNSNFKIHETWRLLSPTKLHEKYYNDFDYDLERIGNILSLRHIPKEVLLQWNFLHFENYEMQRNYAWMDYSKMQFRLETWNLERLLDIYVISDFRDYVERRAASKSFDEFFCIDADKHEWESKGTWRTPPIILDCKSITANIPKYSEISKGFQLVEGHSRLGYLYSLMRFSKQNIVTLANKHNVFVMSYQNI